jgi:hypothetical protein
MAMWGVIVPEYGQRSYDFDSFGFHRYKNHRVLLMLCFILIKCDTHNDSDLASGISSAR